MPYYRRLPSGKHQMTVRLPSGKKVSRSHQLKKVVADWAREEESRIARGEWRDPRSGRIDYEEWRDRFLAARVVEPETARRDQGVLANHLNPQWSGWRVPAITRLEVQGWVKRMQSAGVGPHAIRHAYNFLSTMLNAAVDEGVITASPCRRIDLPAAPPKLPEWFTREQVDAIAAALPPRHATAVHLMAWHGLRWGETAGLRVGRVAFLRRRLTVDGVNTQHGRWKPYPKSSKSRRELPVEAEVLELLAPLAAGRGDEELMFRTVRRYRGEERPWSGANWRIRWYEGIEDARKAHPELNIPAYSPHALRHSAASWLVQDGVPLYDVQALLGHESFQVTQRYSHLAPDAHSVVEDAWRRLRAHQRRTAPGAGERPGI
ncbi:MAG: site-specific integrase [Streptosporangiaceae bacterium]|nr:site-specific integrase [Streptosporangiaceae bacterium]